MASLCRLIPDPLDYYALQYLAEDLLSAAIGSSIGHRVSTITRKQTDYLPRKDWTADMAIRSTALID